MPVPKKPGNAKKPGKTSVTDRRDIIVVPLKTTLNFDQSRIILNLIVLACLLRKENSMLDDTQFLTYYIYVILY